MRKNCKITLTAVASLTVTLCLHSGVHIYFTWNNSGNNDPVLPRLSTPPQIKDITTSTIEIEWKGDYDGDGPVCGFIVELKPSASTSWKNVGFVSFDEDRDDFEYTIERLDADALYGISVRILHCSGKGKGGPEINQSTKDYALPRLLTQPQVQNVTTSTIEIEWRGDYEGDGPVCGFVVELKPLASKSWTSVGFVPFNEDEDDFEYIIDRLDASALYWISVIILHCSGMEGVRGPEISQSTEDHEPQTEPPAVSTSPAPPCPPNPPKDDHRYWVSLLGAAFIDVAVNRIHKLCW